MNVQDDFDRQIASWLAEGPHRLPEAAIDRIVADVEQSRTRKLAWLPRRETMNRILGAAGSSAAVVVLAVLGVGLVSGGGLFGPSAVSQSPTASPTLSAPSASPTLSAPPAAAEAGLPHGPFNFVEVGNVMRMTITIPAPGWHFRDQRALFFKGGESAGVPEAWVMLHANTPGTAFSVPGDPCRVNSTKPRSPAITVDDLVADLAAQDPGDASEPVDVTVGGYAGTSITLHVPDDAVVEGCEEGFFVRYGYAENPVWHNNYGPGQIDEFWILDVDGSVVVLDAMYRPDTSAELVEEMRAIVESTTFGTP
jgi:hypothetical protein